MTRGSAWVTLQGDGEVEAFIDAAVELHRPLLSRLSPRARPFFFDAWLRRLNASDAYLLRGPDGPQALVTVPRTSDRHQYRWQNRTLAVRDDVAPVTLPAAVDLTRSFLVPCADGEVPTRPLVAGAAATPVQLGYVRSLEAVTAPGGSRWTMRPLVADDLGPVLDLLGRCYDELDDHDGSLDRQRLELQQMLGEHAGWCFVATAPGDARPLAVASYLLRELPLVGVPSALVGDLAVDPEARRQHLARDLQWFAYQTLRRDGLDWVHGNIDPGNAPSRGQAVASGRTIWFTGLRFTGA